MGERDLIIGRWNKGEISSAELIRLFSEELIARLRLRGVTLSGYMVTRLEAALSRREKPDSFSARHFLEYAEHVLCKELPGSEQPGSWEILDEGWQSHDWHVAYTAERMEHLELLEAEEKLASSENTAQAISFSSLGFAPSSKEHAQKFDQIVSGLGSIEQLTKLIDRLESRDPALSRLATLRLFGGLTLTELSARTGLGIAQVRKDWECLKSELGSLTNKPVSPLVLLPFDEEGLLKTLYGHPELLRTLDWRSFEKVLASILERLGFVIELQQGTKDGGIDIFALKADPAFGAHRYLIQAKRWSHKVGVEPVRELLFLQSHYRASKGCLATTASFSRGAWRLAKEYRWQLELRDLKGLQEWLEIAVNQPS